MRRTSISQVAGVILAVLSLGAGCTEPASEDIRPSMPIADDSATDGGKNPSDKVPEDKFDATGYVEIDGFRFKIPEGWKRVELTPVQRGFISARYLIPSEGEELQVTFSTAKGGIEANFQRWIGQFQLDSGTKPFREWLTVAGAEAEWIELRGTYSGGFGAGGELPRPGYALLGAGIPVADGEMYVKLTGPAAPVDRVKETVHDVVVSARLP